jgi:prophage tail gpP-like protein
MAGGEPAKVELFHADDSDSFDQWDSFSIRDSFTDPLGSFDFTASPTEKEFPRYHETLRKGDIILIQVNGRSAQVGLIQTTTSSFSRGGGGKIQISGQSPLVTLYQGQVDPDLSLKRFSDASAKSFADGVTPVFGMFVYDTDDHAAIINAMTGKPLSGGVGDEINVKELKTGDAEPNRGETAYGYLSRILTRVGVVLRMRPDGWLTMTGPHYEQASIYSAGLDSRGSPPIGDVDYFRSVTIRDSNDGQYSDIVVRGVAPDKKNQKYTGRPHFEISSGAYVDLRSDGNHELYRGAGSAVVTKAKLYAPNFKPLYIQDDSTRDITYARNAALLAFGLRAPKAYQINGTVDGLVSATGRVWTIDTICNVAIPQISLNEDMWLMERTLRSNRSVGQQTDLRFIPKGFLTIGEPKS